MEHISAKPPLLFLCHRIPFPPNKGDKIRSFNILKKLSEHYEVHLGCFIDDPFDRQYVDGLKTYCRSIFYLNQNKVLSKIKGLQAFFTHQAITLPYYYDKRMKQWVERTVLKYRIDKIFIYSSSMAQYCQKDAEWLTGTERVIDFVDVDSDKWRQYAEKKQGIARWVFQREYRLLAQYEDTICSEFDHSLFVSPDEAQLFNQRQPDENKHKVHGVLNGVDIDFFNPQANFSTESLVPSSPFITFTGAMDYWANVDAVTWFVEQVWPLVLLKHPEAIFCIVGGNPSQQVYDLAKHTGVVVTGRVHDVRPFIMQATCVVAPLQIARGIQNKVLEAMSLNKAIVVTSMAMEGINAPASAWIKIVDQAHDYAEACNSYLTQELALISHDIPETRQWIVEHFTWQQTLLPLAEYFSDSE